MPTTVASKKLQQRSAHWRDYLELTKPRVVALLLLTAVVGMALAQTEWVALDVLIPALAGIAPSPEATRPGGDSWRNRRHGVPQIHSAPGGGCAGHRASDLPQLASGPGFRLDVETRMHGYGRPGRVRATSRQ